MIRLNSPNKGTRPAGTVIDAIVIHADAGMSDQGTVAWLMNPESKVSYHYFCTRLGTVYQFVSDTARAWHAGASALEGRADCNNFSIGVAFANNQAGEAFTEPEISAGVILVGKLCREHKIPVDRVVTHAAVATPAGRKHDPGPLFPWDEFIARVEAAVKG